MRAVLQRVANARVEVDDLPVSSIGEGLLVFVGIEHGDSKEDAEWLVGKICGMRIFQDEHGLMNHSVQDKQGEVLIVSQFTLHASTKKGNRPSFIKAASHTQARALYDFFCDEMKARMAKTATGVFGAMMQVHLLNDGPVTILLDSNNKE